jgi:flagellin
MAMVINTNTASLTTQRHLSSSRNDMEVSMERMSSGSRVNSSMDDAAGLAIGNRMTSQVEGLNQAVRNANDGISLAQTAEGALQSSSNILQRIRVLAVQAANDTYSAMDRKALNNEIVQLKEELNRGVNQASFNGKKILDGTNESFTFQVGHKSGDNVVVNLGDMRGSKIGTQSWNTKTQTAVTAVPATATMTISGAVKTNDTMTMTVSGQAFAHTFTANADETVSARAYVVAWNNSATAGVAAYTASNVGGVITITQDTATTGALTAAGSVAQVGGSSTIAVATAADAGTTGIAGVAATALVTVPSTVAAVTAVAAVPATAVMTISGAAIKATDTITMTAGSATFAHTFTTDGQTLTANIAEYVAAWNASDDADVSLYTASNVAGVITITEDTATTGNLTVAGAVLQTGVSSDILVASAAAAGTLGVAGVAEQESYDYSGITLVSGDRVSLTIGTKTYTQEFTTNQATTLNALGALVVNGNASYVSKTVDASGKLVFTGAAEGTALAAATAAVQTSSVSAANSVDDILVTDVASAKAALAVVDSALEMMSDFRAVLGASSNRMFITVDNLMSMSENTSAARSRIVDADFAAESASLAKSQVLQQAGTAMLSQANASTQDILSLLK